jgi:hypothetical protein
MTNKSLICILVVSLFMASCYPRYRTTPTPSTPRSAWLTKFLHNPTCQAPCWENIIPGKTTITEAKRILFTEPDIEITYETSEAVQWKFLPNLEGGWVESQIDDYGMKIIDQIHLGLKGRQALQLREIVETYGQPAFIVIFREIHFRDACDVYIAYTPFDMVLSYFMKCFITKTKNGGQSIKLEISEDTLIESINLVSKGVKAFTLVDEFPENILLWNGYGEYEKIQNP